MEVFNLESFTKGWFVGAFEPTLLPTNAVEVGIKHYRAGEKEAAHHHKIATELTAIISGRVRMSGRVFETGQIVRIAPGESTDFEVLEDTTTVVVKIPSAIGDKYID